MNALKKCEIGKKMYGLSSFYEPRVAIVLKHCQDCMRVHVCVGFVMGRLWAYFLHIA